MVLALPPAPPELKSITPYLQRADEVASTDPVVSYWCAYFAAQQGIALKVKDTSARHFLFDLLGLLERMKNEIGPNDAVHDEPASAAYVENFALRVFASADNEDRRANVTRNTAKKFLAAANFLELLRIFDPDKAAVDLASVEEKIRYAKWKAADIAKAIREGRKPTPGPAASPAPDPDLTIPAAPDLPDLNLVPPSTPPPGPAIIRTTPPPPHLSSLPSVEPSDHLNAYLPDGLAPPQPPHSPGSWSTVATPGTPGFHLEDATVSPSPMDRPRGVHVSGELEGKTDEEIDAELTPPSSGAKSVHFSGSVVGGLETPSAPDGYGPEHDPFAAGVVVNPPPPSAPSLGSPSYNPTFLPSAPPLPPPPPPVPRTGPPPAPTPSAPYSHAAAGYIHPSAPSPDVDGSTSTVTTMPAELTPQVIARIQKHCRFAISALDYEDQEQARKELRAALRMLGG